MLISIVKNVSSAAWVLLDYNYDYCYRSYESAAIMCTALASAMVAPCIDRMLHSYTDLHVNGLLYAATNPRTG